jgi:hypothetical protein
MSRRPSGRQKLSGTPVHDRQKFYFSSKAGMKRDRWRLVASLLMLVVMGTGLGLVSLYFAAAYYLMPMFKAYFTVDYLVVLNLLPVVWLVLVLFLILNRVWLSFLLGALITLGLSFVNYAKLLIRNDPLIGMDLGLFFESLTMAGEFSLPVDWKIITVLAAVISGTLFSRFFLKGRLSRPGHRALYLVLLLVVGGGVYDRIYSSEGLYVSRRNETLISPWSQTQVYISKGFVYPFIHSFSDPQRRPPEGYDPGAVEEILQAYGPPDIPEEKRVHVIAVMLEAFKDFSDFEQLDFARDIYGPWHELEKESHAGSLIVDVFAGDTVKTEWGFLTGYTELYSFRRPLNAYVRIFKDQGYTVEGSHPSYDWFYNRININGYLGFDAYYYFENHYRALSPDQLAGDGILFDEIIRLYEVNRATGQPYFSFNVTYQNHGPYPSDHLAGEAVLEETGLSEADFNLINNYLLGIEDTIGRIEGLIDYFEAQREPVVVILFGDHSPWLGDHQGVYRSLGIDLDPESPAGFFNTYTTPYLIWGNPAAKESLGRGLVGEGPAISPNFLMSEFFSLAGYEGDAFMQYSDRMKAVLPVIHDKGFFLEKGVLTPELSEENLRRYREFLQVQYYWRENLD